MQATLPKISESEFTRQVIELAKLCGFHVAHFRPAMNRRGAWATAMSGDVGWPDLFLVNAFRGICIAAELKVAKRKTTPEQEAWIKALRAAGVLACVWRPEDWPTIEAILKGQIAPDMGLFRTT